MQLGCAQDALIGFSGFVGSTLIKQASFDSLYRSTNINLIAGKCFNNVVCAGAPAQKWIANHDPDADRKKIEALIAQLKNISCKTFVLISTVDVFKTPIAVDEDTPIDVAGLHAYGLNRYTLEQFVRNHFPQHLIVRLPGLVGPGLRKNLIFDFLNGNNLSAFDCRSIFQYYPMINLWHDIQTAMMAGIRLIHLTAEPISVEEVSLQCFGKSFELQQMTKPIVYDMRTNYAKLYGAAGLYQYSRRESIQAIRAYAQSEPIKPKGN